jgi:tRNA-(ms[2]io[6]A)-hydroxylase
MVDLACEELEHFRLVHRVIEARGLRLAPDTRDAYVRALQQQCRKGSKVYFLDRLLVAGIVEARGCERFGLVADALPAGELKELYVDFTRSEARHHGLFARLARVYFDEAAVATRTGELLEVEAEVMVALPLRPALH